MERTALSLKKKEYNIFRCCKKSRFIILLIFVPISRVAVTSLETNLLFVDCLYSFEENLLFLSANFDQCYT